MNVYFYSTTEQVCEPEVKHCYCDELCHLERHNDCCLSCWGPADLGCDFYDFVTKRFRKCSRVETMDTAIATGDVSDLTHAEMRFLDDPTAKNAPCWDGVDSGKGGLHWRKIQSKTP